MTRFSFGVRPAAVAGGLAAASLLVLGACSVQDTFLEPQNPGLIDPSAVSNPSAASGSSSPQWAPEQ